MGAPGNGLYLEEELFRQDINNASVGYTLKIEAANVESTGATDVEVEGIKDVIANQMVAAQSISNIASKEVKAEYVQDVKAECDYRLEQLAHSTNQREAIFRDMIAKAEDEKRSGSGPRVPQRAKIL